MSEPFEVVIRVPGAADFEAPLDGPLELGRQRADEPEPFCLLPAADGPARLVVAPQLARDNVSRRHLTLEPQDDGLVRVSNHSQFPLATDEGQTIPPGASADLAPPFGLCLGDRLILVSRGDEHGISTLDQPTAAPDADLSLGPLDHLGPEQMRALLDGVPRALGLLQRAVGRAELLKNAAAALVEVFGLDSGRVLLRRGGLWEVAAAHGTALDVPSPHAVERLEATRCAVWRNPDPARDSQPEGAVAAPLLDHGGAVLGALYGERRQDGPRLGRVEALLTNVLAGAVSSGLIRLVHERAFALCRQSFTHELARRLAKDPAPLEAREAEVTVLSAGLRRFREHHAKLGAADSVRLLNEVLGELSVCVRDEGGTLVASAGARLLATWGAPEPQPDQAARAVRAGLRLHAALSGLNQRWQETLGEPFALGVGIHSGPATVGNVGSKLRFEYGPLGDTVDLAGRIQRLTPFLRCGLLVSDQTRRQLESFVCRRVIKARVSGVEEPVDLYEVERAGDAERRVFFEESQAALDALEAGQFAQAARAAGAGLSKHPGDGPLLLVLARAATALVEAGVGFDPVWTPPGK